MKQISILAAIVFGISFASQAQTGTATLNVKLNPIQTLVVNPSQTTVDLVYTTKDDYANGVKSAQQDHLSIYSTGGFEVSVKSAGSELTKSSAGNASPSGNIAANTISIVPSKGNQEITGATYTTQALSATNQAIVSSATGGVDKTINIEYQGGDANKYLNHYVAGQTPTVYTTTVTYTIVAK